MLEKTDCMHYSECAPTHTKKEPSFLLEPADATITGLTLRSSETRLINIELKRVAKSLAYGKGIDRRNFKNKV
jgi:hypothetical protein